VVVDRGQRRLADDLFEPPDALAALARAGLRDRLIDLALQSLVERLPLVLLVLAGDDRDVRDVQLRGEIGIGDVDVPGAVVRDIADAGLRLRHTRGGPGESTWVAAISPRTIGTTTRTTHQYFLGYVPVSTLVIARSLRHRRVPVLRDVRRPTLASASAATPD